VISDQNEATMMLHAILQLTIMFTVHREAYYRHDVSKFTNTLPHVERPPVHCERASRPSDESTDGTAE